MDPAAYDNLERTLDGQGAEAALERLCAQLRDEGDYSGLFYALLMKKRHELGVNPVPTGPASDLPSEVHLAYEGGIRDAAREVGDLYLKNGNLPQAWVFFRMIEEPEPVREALEKYQPGD